MEDPDNPERLLKIPPHVFQAIEREKFHEGYIAGLDDAEVALLATVDEPHPAVYEIRYLRNIVTP